MKRFFILSVLTLTTFVPLATAHAASLPLLDPGFSIVPSECWSDCPCGIGAVVIAIQNIMNVMISIAVIAMTLIMVWAGFMFIASASNPESRSKAKSMLINAAIGMFIVLAGWLIVDFIMKKLYNPDSEFGPWNSILMVGDAKVCVEKLDHISQIQGLPSGLQTIEGAVTGTSGSSGGGGTTAVPVGGNAVSSLSAQAAAKTLLASSNVSSTNSVSSCGTYAGGTSNLQQVAAGQGMKRCPCGGGGSVAPSETLLNSLIDMANAGAKFQINVIAGGCHSGGANDNHYLGKAADIQKSSSLDAFFSRYPKVSCQKGKVGYRVSGEIVCFEDSHHYHVSPTGG